MTATNANATQRVASPVEATNPKGIKVGGRWLNWSQYGPPLPRPERGRRVGVTVDGKGFIKALELVDGAADAPQCPTAGRETAITRLAVLKAAAEFAAGPADIKSGDVLAIAERWEAWVRR